MLYPHNTEKTLTKALFENPGSEYRGTPFWAWNCKLEKDELLRQLDIMKKMGLGGAHMHVRTGMATPYLSDEYMDLISACVEKCRQENMLAWLYDEDRWPSGAAGGLLTKDVRYRSRHLLFTTIPYGQFGKIHNQLDSSARSSRTENGYLLSCYDVVLDEEGCIQSARRIGEKDEAVGRKWYAYVETQHLNPWYNNQTYANTLDKETIRQFVKITHERYLEKVGKDFGGVIPAIFTDEPQFARKDTLHFAKEVRDVTLPWTDDVPETYLAAYGEDLLDKLPELFWELPKGQISVARYHYHDHIAERFASAFADTCGDWCKEHGIMLTGHMMEEPTLESQTAALGEAMRSYRSFQLPGIDMLCNRFEFTTAKQAQSASRQYGCPGVLSELYGVTGWQFDFRGHKLQGDWQAALGVTVRVQHLAWVSMKGEAKRDYPASINYQSPWWQDYAYVEDHFARVNTAMTRGKALVKVGVIHPVESYWLHWGPQEQTHGVRSQMDSHFQDLTDWLLKGSIDFDFISESLLPAQCKQPSAPLKVGEMAYDVIIVPGCETLRSTTLDRLEAFRKAGGKLIFLGNAPKLTDAVPSPRGQALWQESCQVSFSREDVLSALSDVRMVDIRNHNGSRTENLVHQLRQDGDALWLFIAHGALPVDPSVSTPQEVRILVKGKHHVSWYDTQTGDVKPIRYAHENGQTVIYFTFHDYDSLLLRLEENAQAEACTPVESAVRVLRHLPVPQRVHYALSEDNALLLDVAEFALNDEPYRPRQEILRADNELRLQLGWPDRQSHVAQPWTIQEEKAPHTVHLRFTVHSRMKVENAHFAMEDAELASVKVNGTPISNKPDGYFVDKSIQTLALPALPEGDSTIEVTLPYGRRTDLEWCYLLGAFGVNVQGSYQEIVPLPEKLGFDSVVMQQLPHYSGNIRYDIPVEAGDKPLCVTVPLYHGAAVRVQVDGKDAGHIVYPPYQLNLGQLIEGQHTLSLVLLGTRINAFGPVHRVDHGPWCGPDAWRTTNNYWTDSYRFQPLGIASTPWITECEETK